MEPVEVPVNEAVVALVEFARRVRRRVGSLKPLGVGVSDALGEDARIEAGDGGLVSVAPFRGRPLQLVHRVGVSRPSGIYAAVDGSSRKLESLHVLLSVFTVAVGVYSGSLDAMVYPPTGEAGRLNVTVSPYTVAPGELAPDDFIGLFRVKPLVDPHAVLQRADLLGEACGGDRGCVSELESVLSGLEYGRSFDKHTMLDEGRSYMENAALKRIVEMLAGRGESVVLVDGPVYYTPSLFNMVREPSSRDASVIARSLVRAYYALTYYTLLLARLRVTLSAVERGVRVVGFVKRLERSRLLARALGAGDVRDDSLAASLAAQAGGGVVAIGPVIVRIDVHEVFKSISSVLRLDDEMLVKLPVYIDDPAGVLCGLAGRCYPRIAPSTPELVAAKRCYYIVAPSLPTVYRVEIPCIPVTECLSRPDSIEPLDPDDAARLASLDMQLISEVLWLSMQSEAGLPTPLLLADRFASRGSKLYASFSARLLVEAGVKLSYESLLEAGIVGG